MIPSLIHARGPVDAWLRVVELLATSGDKFNVVVSIQAPLEFSEDDLEKYDPRKKCEKARSVADVANTIFPKRSKWWAQPDAAFIAHYGPAYDSLLRSGPRAWGMYFLRLVRFGDRRINQLEKVVQGLSTWGRNHKAAFVVHFSSAETDAPRPLGAPCLQYCEFLREGGEISLLAVYRSHDYFYKALGNFIGLARLLSYVSERTGIPAGSIICHSTYAFLDGKRRAARELAAEGSR